MGLLSPTSWQRDIRYYKIIKKPVERLRYSDTSGAAMAAQNLASVISQIWSAGLVQSHDLICSAPTDTSEFKWSSSWRPWRKVYWMRRHNVSHTEVSFASELSLRPCTVRHEVSFRFNLALRSSRASLLSFRERLSLLEVSVRAVLP